jgi:glycosyltransferase involved in cell wall biosynthesis
MRLQFVVPFGPRFDSKHGGRVIAQLLDQLVDRHEVAVVYQRLPGSSPIDSDLSRRCAEIREVPLSASAPFGSQWAHQKRVLRALLGGMPTPVSAIYSRRFAEIAREVALRFVPDLVQIEHDALGYCLPELAIPGLVRVLVCHDPGLNASRDLVAVTRGRRRLAHQLDVRAWRRYWAHTLPEADVVVTFTRDDARSVVAAAPGTPVETIPLGINVPDQPSDPVGQEPPEVLFIGGYVHPPNADAALRLMTAIMPIVRRQCPELRLTLVGDRPTQGMIRAAGRYDEVTGAVPSVAPYVDRAALLVVPIRLGGGMRVKLLEGLAAGKAVVASPLAAAGLEVQDGRQVQLADTDEQFAREILYLLDHPDARRRLAGQARAWAVGNLDWERRVERYEALYARLLSAPQSPV